MLAGRAGPGVGEQVRRAGVGGWLGRAVKRAARNGRGFLIHSRYAAPLSANKQTNREMIPRRIISLAANLTNYVFCENIG